jgi:hypothetical protein
MLVSEYEGQGQIFTNPEKTRRFNMKVSKAIHSYQEYHRLNSKKKYAEKL